MIRNFFIFCFLTLSFQIFPQNSEAMKSAARFASDIELSSYINKAKSSGLTLIEVEKIVSTQGASFYEIEKLRKLWQGSELKTVSSQDNLDLTIESTFGNESVVNNEIKIQADIPERFGSNFFQNKNISEIPQLFIATPSDYRLGPGDEIIVNLYGASENSYSVQISRNGTVKFDRLPPIYLSGLSVNFAKTRLKSSLSKLYAGLTSNDQLTKVNIDVSLKKARSVVINITGQVTAPGTYTISGFSSVLNALYAAGGPNAIGSFRSIKLIRNGKLSKIIDLYDYFVRGIYPSVYLRDQDVILVESYNKQVEVNSGLKINALYEITENETIKDVLNFAGGFSSNSYKDKLFVNRINSFSRSVMEISKEDFSKFKLEDGDIVNAKEVSDLVINSVFIEGSVFIPGLYDLSKVLTVGDLIISAKGLMPDASTSAILYKTNLGIENEIISINLNNEKSLNTELSDQDRLVIFSLKDFEFKTKITVLGEVNNQSEFDFISGMTVRDAIQLSNGFTDFANKSKIKIIRNISVDNSDEITKEFSLDFTNESNQNNFKLQTDDIIAVPKIPYLKPTRSFSVKGEVSVENVYSISSKNYSIADAFRDNIKLVKNSSTDGIYVVRDSIKIPINGIKVSQNIFKPKTELQLKANDIIFIPSLDNSVTVKGSVQQETIFNFEKSKSFKYAISAAGGYLENADRKRVYIEYQNGQKKSIKTFLGIRTYPKILPGSQIFVPQRNDTRSKTSVAEIVGYTTSLVSIIALIKSL